jgi:hypothetical protein
LLKPENARGNARRMASDYSLVKEHGKTEWREPFGFFMRAYDGRY